MVFIGDEEEPVLPLLPLGDTQMYFDGVAVANGILFAAELMVRGLYAIISLPQFEIPFVLFLHIYLQKYGVR
jgi:hypothetical protein